MKKSKPCRLNLSDIKQTPMRLISSALRLSPSGKIVTSCSQKQRLKEIEEMAKVFDGLAGPLQTYDESYVRQLISRIDIYDDKVTITFKDGQAIDINE